jgi:hypothetical protein
MKERPIPFKGDMVRAILEGRKTMTRRPVEPQPEAQLGKLENSDLWTYTLCDREWKCPYGQPGDRLWCKETWFPFLMDKPEEGYLHCAQYRATYRGKLPADTHWKPSIHMPRWASRITLEVVNVRVERLREIGLDDIAIEGFRRVVYPQLDGSDFVEPPRDTFRRYWDSLYTKKPEYQWQANPWVWVIEFKGA